MSRLPFRTKAPPPVPRISHHPIAAPTSRTAASLPPACQSQDGKTLAKSDVFTLETLRKRHLIHRRTALGLTFLCTLAPTVSVGVFYGLEAACGAFILAWIGGGVLGRVYERLFLRPLDFYLHSFFEGSGEIRSIETYAKREVSDPTEVVGLIQRIERLENPLGEYYKEKKEVHSRLAEELSKIDPNQKAFIEGVKKLFFHLIKKNEGDFPLLDLLLLSVFSAQARRMNPEVKLIATRLLVLSPLADIIRRNSQFLPKAQELVRFLIADLPEEDALYQAALRRYSLGQNES